MDHDRSTGEGVGPQEYTLIKMKLLQTRYRSTVTQPFRLHGICWQANNIRLGALMKWAQEERIRTDKQMLIYFY